MDTNTLAIWQGSGSYIADPSTTPRNMLDDAGCFMETAEALISTIIDGLEDEGGTLAANPRQVATALHGIRYLLQIGHNMSGAAHSQMNRDRKAALGRAIGPVLAEACGLEPADRYVVERFLQAGRTAGLVLDADSVKTTDDETLRGMWGAA
ncbi:hypothetical protein ACW5EG_02050 [Luteimonas sp. A611]